MRSDLSPTDLAYADRTIIVGFLLADASFECDQPTLERKAELLEMILLEAIWTGSTSAQAVVQAAADHVLKLFSNVTVSGAVDFDAPRRDLAARGDQLTAVPVHCERRQLDLVALQPDALLQ